MSWWAILLCIVIGALLGAAVCYIILLIYLSRAFRW
jgi:hypothetical protein